MKISYLVTCSTETTTLKTLIERIYTHLGTDELVILQDESNWNIDRKKYLADITELSAGPEIVNLPIFVHSLNNDFGEHKNHGNSLCSGDWIFQLDGDELPPETLLGDNLKSIIESNPNVELICVPRINDQRGVTEEDAKEFGWRLVYLPEYENGKVPLVSWPDYQTRIYKNVPDRIKWKNKLHEVMDGYTEYSPLPDELDYAIYHDKTIETARETNRNYRKTFFPS